MYRSFPSSFSLFLMSRATLKRVLIGLAGLLVVLAEVVIVRTMFMSYDPPGSTGPTSALAATITWR